MAHNLQQRIYLYLHGLVGNSEGKNVAGSAWERRLLSPHILTALVEWDNSPFRED